MTSHQVTFTLERDDYVRSSRSLFHSRRDTRAIYLFIGLGAFIVLAAYLTRDTPNYPKLALYLMALAALALVVWASPHLSVSQNLKNHTLAFVPQTWSFSPSGVQVASGSATSSFEWSSVLKVVEDARYFLVHISDGTAYPIPKRVFSVEEMGAFRARLREWLGERAAL